MSCLRNSSALSLRVLASWKIKEGGKERKEEKKQSRSDDVDEIKPPLTLAPHPNTYGLEFRILLHKLFFCHASYFAVQEKRTKKRMT